MAYQDKVLRNRIRSLRHPRVLHNFFHLSRAQGSCTFVYEFGNRRHTTSSRLSNLTSQCSCPELQEKRDDRETTTTNSNYRFFSYLDQLTGALHIEARYGLCACTKSCAILSSSLLAWVIAGSVSGRCSSST
jgi:hypothetical protein